MNWSSTIQRVVPAIQQHQQQQQAGQPAGSAMDAVRGALGRPPQGQPPQTLPQQNAGRGWVGMAQRGAALGNPASPFGGVTDPAQQYVTANRPPENWSGGWETWAAQRAQQGQQQPPQQPGSPMAPNVGGRWGGLAQRAQQLMQQMPAQSPSGRAPQWWETAVPGYGQGVNSAFPGNAGSMVRMRAPNGMISMVPASHADHYTGLGGQLMGDDDQDDWFAQNPYQQPQQPDQWTSQSRADPYDQQRAQQQAQLARQRGVRSVEPQDDWPYRNGPSS